MEYTDDEIEDHINFLNDKPSKADCIKAGIMLSQLLRERDEAREALVIHKKQASDVVELLIDKINKILMEAMTNDSHLPA